MPRPMQWILMAVCLSGMALLGSGRAGAAENAGQGDLDKATKARVTARTLDDLDEVIRLCESAQRQGLDKENAAFANQMLSSALIQRGLVKAKAIFERSNINAAWLKIRDAALADLDRGTKLDPQQPEAYLYIARLNLLPGGERKRAAEALDEAIRTGVDNADVRAKSLVLRADLDKDLKQRTADLEAAVQAAPGDPAILLAHGLFLADLGKMDRALADFQKVTELAPEQPAGYEGKAVVLSRQKKYDEALVALDKLRELEPESVHPLLQVARVHTLQANLNAALHDLEQALTKKPDDVETLLLRSGIYQELGQFDKALADVNRALDLRPGLAPAIRARGLLLAESGKVAAAIADLETLHQANPKDVATLLQLGLLCTLDRKHDKAIELYTAALALEPTNLTALRNRGDARLGIGKHVEAIADYEQALKIDPKDVGLLNNLAWVLATSPVDKLRNGSRAVVLATEACKQTDYKKPHILSTLAAAYAETGDFDTARQWSEKALALGLPKQKKALARELKSYQAKKPWRELETGKEEEREGDELEESHATTKPSQGSEKTKNPAGPAAEKKKPGETKTPAEENKPAIPHKALQDEKPSGKDQPGPALMMPDDKTPSR